ncbi:unnamed protein product [Acanthoscelides obtectus]|uniref:Uncharacterized protein n=1 Tax=Acanthoscelides obtectus TaxID=200917 RepID=A0A9P0KBM6_ACAOB|nr:unnamed protein product [Acanthoscelides obtectus]CAK1635521.1 hypothetical protein AOBTE_LOCUS9332 [Acanthoscelides obtectus]
MLREDKVICLGDVNINFLDTEAAPTNYMLEMLDSTVACSHVRAWKLYAESVRNDKAFPATKCTLWRGPEKLCNFTVDAYLGYINNGKAKGSYFLITHETKPYGRRRKKIRS